MASEKLVSLRDFEKYAVAKLDRTAREFYQTGAYDETTLRDNVNAFSRYRLRPRVLKDVSQIDMSTTILGTKIDFPVCVSPAGLQRLAHSDGETASARACQDMGTCFAVSNGSSCSLEEIAEAAPNGMNWFQFYMYNSRPLHLVKVAEQCGYKAIIFTVDVPASGRNWTRLRNEQFILPPHIRCKIFDTEDKWGLSAFSTVGGDQQNLRKFLTDIRGVSVTWKDFKEIRSLTQLPIVVKGIMTAEDALIAVENGVDAIVVSNHGGRHMDGIPATIDALAEIAPAVNGRCEVYVDGGVRTGIDVMKCLALGARAVFVARPVLWGLAYNGYDGVKQVLQILKDELKNAMTLTGVSSIQDICPEMVVNQTYYDNLKNKL